MEKIISQEQQKTISNECLILENRKRIKIEGIVEINSSSESGINLKLKDTSLNITGSNIHITKLDITCGVLEAEGLFDGIKYGKSANIFKRLFK